MTGSNQDLGPSDEEEDNPATKAVGAHERYPAGAPIANEDLGPSNAAEIDRDDAIEAVTALVHELPAIETVIAAGTLGSFATAFCAELGRRLGGTLADWASRVHLRRRHSGSAMGDLYITGDDEVVSVVEFSVSLPDEAKLALLDLDVTSPPLRGRRLAWNAEAKAWVPIDPQG
jgi:hypothetical protein